MKNFIQAILCVVILTSLCQLSFAGCNAGTLLYFKHKDKIYLLLADHNPGIHGKRGWSGFGGRCDDDDPDKAAARETEEETRGLFERSKILDKIRSSPKIKVYNFTTFFVEVDPFPVILIKNQNPTSHADSYNERGPYAWIPFSEIWQAIENMRSGRAHISKKYLPPDSHTDWLFENFVRSLRQAKRAEVFP